MPCFYPIDGWRSKNPNDNGKYPIVFSRSAAQQDSPLRIACGQCTGCRLERSRQWAMRCLHEASQYTDNSFLTLTYNDDNVPFSGTLDHEHFQLFMKRFRKKYHPKIIRFFMCGEYGTNQDLTTTKTIGRPHYHAIIFNHEFADKIPISQSFDGTPLFTSETLSKLWPYGFNSIGDVTFESAAYVARYVLKKINGPDAAEHYETISLYGEIEQLKPEYTSQSTKPGIGKKWFDKYRHDLDKGFITIRGIKMPPPTYYNYLYEKHHDDEYMFIKEEKRQSIDPLDPNNTMDRLRTREKIQLKKLKQLKRETI